MRASSDIPRRFSLASHRTRWALVIAAAVLIVVVAVAPRVASLYTDFLWFRSVGFSSVWTKTITIQIGLGCTFTVVLFGLLWGNLVLADRLAPTVPALAPADELVARWQELAAAHMRWVRLVVCAGFALIGGVSAHSQWDNWLLFSNAKPFSASSAPWTGTDPLNHMNDGFYVFRLPFLDWVVGWAFAAIVVTLLLCLVAHYLNGGVRPHSSMQRVSPQVKAHLSVLLAVLALVEGVNYYLQRLSLVLSTKYKIVDGATYTDVHAMRPALLLLIAISAIAAGLFLYNVRQQGWLLPAVAVALWGLVWVLVANVYPAVVQSLVVNPAQNVKELPYITDNITATTSAYGLQNVSEVPFEGGATITAPEVTGKSSSSLANQQSLANIPLLDAGLSDINSVFTAKEGFWNYYSMSGPTTDRYDLATGPGGSVKETQVLVSARQLNSGGVSGSWVNQHLQYTHGYGAVVTPANQAGVDPTDGYPAFSLAGLPPTGQPSVAAQPRIYFDDSGQSVGGYVIADSGQREVDYEDPVTRNEKTSNYTGPGGVMAGGLLRRLAFAVSFSDYNILISSEVNSSSRILYYRNVVERLEKAAPFLSYDSDPYPVILDGRLYWVVDAYTTTDNFPYSEQAGSNDGAGVNRLSPTSALANEPFNYLRNSVKAVVDAYSGKMWLFVQDPDDPIIQTYERAFPKLFTPMTQANSDIAGITNHWRYPEDIFTVQTNMFSTYHQQNAPVFYNNSQAWGIAQNPGAGEVGAAATSTVPSVQGGLGAPTVTTAGPQDVMPLYELVALPGQSHQSFVLVQPFVPSSSSGDKQNLTAFMTASSDPADYGALSVYTIPAGQTVDGPHLVSTAVETNSAISSVITLLGRVGSKVVLGNVVLTPIGQALLYTQPLYVAQTSNGIPRLGDVIVVYDGTAFQSGTTSPTLGAALCQVTNPGGGHPFASYCSSPPVTTKPSHPRGKGGPHTTTTVPATTTTVPSATTTSSTTPSGPPVPTPHETVAQYLATAEQDFAYADAALKAGDLGTYQNDIRAAEAAVADAYNLEQARKKPTTTTTSASGPTRTSGRTRTSGLTSTSRPTTTSSGPPGTSRPTSTSGSRPTTATTQASAHSS